MAREVFDGFELKLPEGTCLSDYMRVHINLESAYKWGSGWTQEDEKNFKMELYPALEWKGFKINYVENGSMGCDTLSIPNAQERGNNFYCYMHPMDFSCIATKEQLEKLCDVLSQAECIKDFSINQYSVKRLYDMSDREYENILIDNSDRILDRINSHKGRISSCEIGFDFASHCRLARITDKTGGGLSSGDIDVKFVEQLYRLREKFHLEDFRCEKDHMVVVDRYGDEHSQEIKPLPLSDFERQFDTQEKCNILRVNTEKCEPERKDFYWKNSLGYVIRNSEQDEKVGNANDFITIQLCDIYGCSQRDIPDILEDKVLPQDFKDGRYQNHLYFFNVEDYHLNKGEDSNCIGFLYADIKEAIVQYQHEMELLKERLEEKEPLEPEEEMEL